MSMGPLMEYVSIVNPSIIITALLGTTLVFVCFSIAAILADRGSWLFLGGTLMTLLTSMSVMSLLNIFMQSNFLYQVCVYVIQYTYNFKTNIIYILYQWQTTGGFRNINITQQSNIVQSKTCHIYLQNYGFHKQFIIINCHILWHTQKIKKKKQKVY